MRRKGLLEAKGELGQGMFYPDAFAVKSILTWEDRELYQIRTVNQANQNDWSRETRKKYPIKVIRIATRMRPRNSPSGSAHVHIWPHTLYSFFLLRNTLLASVLSVLVKILICKAEGPGPLSLTTGLVARIWCFYRRDLASISGWEPKPRSTPFQAETTRDHCRT